MSEKKGFWEGLFGKKEKGSTDTEPTTSTSTTTSSIPESRPYIPTEAEKKETLEHTEKIADDLIENIWKSEYLTPNEKYESLDAYIKNELYVDINKDIFENPAEFDKIDKMIRYNWQERLFAQAKKFGAKAGVSAGATLVIGGIAGIFTGGLSIVPTLVAAGGSIGARGVVETIRGINGIWGKERNMNISLAKDHIFYAMEAQSLAKELKNTADKLEKDPDDPSLNSKRIEISEKLITLIYDNEKQPVNEKLKGIVTKKEEMSRYQEKWNKAEEIVSFAGSIGAGVAYSLTKGVEKLVEQKLTDAASGKLEINLDPDKLYHYVKKIGDGWHYIIKDVDISDAMAKSGENWTNYFHQVGGQAAEAGKLHIGKLSEEAIKKYLSSEASKEIWLKAITSVLGTSIGSSVSAWFTERKILDKQYGAPTLEEITSKEILKEKHTRVLKGALEQNTNEPEAETQPSKEWLKNAKVGDVFMYDNPTDNRKIRIQVTKIYENKVYIKFIDKKTDGSDYVPKKDWFTVDKSNRRILDKWNEKKDYTYDEWVEVSKYLDENQDKIDKLQRDKELVFRESADLTKIGLVKDTIYEIYKIDKDTNKMLIYEKKKGYTSDNLISVKLDKVIGILDLKGEKSTKKEDTEPEKSISLEDIKLVFEKRVKDKEIDSYPVDYKIEVGQVYNYNKKDYIVSKEGETKLILTGLIKDKTGNVKRDDKGFVITNPDEVITVNKMDLIEKFTKYKGEMRQRR